MNATYKVLNNEMLLVEQQCTEYDEEQDDLHRRKMRIKGANDF